VELLFPINQTVETQEGGNKGTLWSTAMVSSMDEDELRKKPLQGKEPAECPPAPKGGREPSETTMCLEKREIIEAG